MSIMASIMRPPYVYQSLNNKDVSILDDDFQPFDFFKIRVMVLEPAPDFDAELQCTIETVNLSDWPDFEAVSYVWGPPVFLKELFCDGSKISITPTLDQVLRRFRKKTEKLRLWVDAVCINQADIREKNQQVQRMGQIYRYARSVLVWLGDGGKMDECIDFLWGLSSSQHESSVTAERAVSSIETEMRRFFENKEEGIEAVQRFLALPWFTRRWIVQEAVQKNAHFYCGSLDITSHALNHAVFTLNKSTFNFDQHVMDHIRALERQGAYYEFPEQYGEDGYGILDILVRFSSCNCTNEHDRIYAHLGLANDVRSPFASLRPEPEHRFSQLSITSGSEETYTTRQSRQSIPIQVDYEANVEHVYADFAESMLNQKIHLELLHCSGAFRPELQLMTTRNKSWVPDWRLPMRYQPLLSVPWFNAGGEQENKPFFNYPWCSVEGLVFDTVRVSCPITEFAGGETPNRREMPPIGYICSALGMSRRYFTGERMWQVLAMTFISDHALNHIHQQQYHSRDHMYNGKLMKRDARERDMHTLLDWWAPWDDARLAAGGRPMDPLDMEAIVKEHSKSLHRHDSIGTFLKSMESRDDWGPTSHAVPSRWHSRIDEELEPYFQAHLDQMYRSDDSTDTNTNDKNPEDKPIDCEWRCQKQGYIWLNPHRRNTERYAELANETLRGRAFFTTEKGYIGIGPDDLVKGDTVAVLKGARTPFVLHQVEGSLAQWRLVGDCYVHGIMGGEALEMDGVLERNFVLV
ncbi:heterokaryon incompatibility protein-domain-containing protein [Pseudomassariella vexata]|uniref:Heterokaryon incompatibility protein-domain-containing protein n=1 Tax=Pseudomassariella vexata TaxID=1141098 RepID=A0A1Y2DW18_9PEZI|nr:heterokaryon incompatibility protein-domain-containing protein [Pseudomassariella vexata]ORY63492.1 heterokaryon incompatibility protein-domain-containing protein [Pseudomassariella vexata]